GRRGRVASPRRSIAPTHRSMARSEALMRAHAPAVRSTGRSEGRRGLPPLLAALAATLWLVSSSVCASSAPTRIVSLNPCLDGLLVELVPHERIAAISHYSRDPWGSTIADIAQTLPITYETAEEVVA